MCVWPYEADALASSLTSAVPADAELEETAAAFAAAVMASEDDGQLVPKVRAGHGPLCLHRAVISVDLELRTARREPVPAAWNRR